MKFKNRWRLVIAVAVAILALAASVYFVAASRSRPWRTVSSGRAGLANTASWGGDSVAWSWNTASHNGVEVRSPFTGTSSQLEPSATAGASDAAWWGGRVYWLRTSTGQIMSADPDGTDLRTVLSLPRDQRARDPRIGGGAAVWFERTSPSIWSIRTFTLGTTDVREVATMTATPNVDHAFVDVVMTDSLLAWAGPDNAMGTGSESVLVCTITDGVVGQPKVLSADPDGTGAYVAFSLAAGDDRIAWTAERPGTTGAVCTWAVGDLRPRDVSSGIEPAYEVDIGSRLAVTKGLVAWCARKAHEDAPRTVAVWAPGAAEVSLRAEDGMLAVDQLTADDSRLAWVETRSFDIGPLRTPEDIAMVATGSSAVERFTPSGLQGGYVDDLRVSGERVTFVSADRDSENNLMFVCAPASGWTQ